MFGPNLLNGAVDETMLENYVILPMDDCCFANLCFALYLYSLVLECTGFLIDFGNAQRHCTGHLPKPVKAFQCFEHLMFLQMRWVHSNGSGTTGGRSKKQLEFNLGIFNQGICQPTSTDFSL